MRFVHDGWRTISEGGVEIERSTLRDTGEHTSSYCETPLAAGHPWAVLTGDSIFVGEWRPLALFFF